MPAGESNIGPIATPDLNNQVYVGSTLYPTIQSAINGAAIFSAGAQVIVPFGATPSDTIAAASGSASVQVIDLRGSYPVYYTWVGSAYSVASTMPAGAQGLVIATPATASGTASLRALVATDIPALAYDASGAAATAQAAAISAAEAYSANASNISSGTLAAARVPTLNQSTTGNAATATNVAYSGLTGTVPTWNQNTTGTAVGLSTSGAQNLVLATPTGASGVPSLRALVANDLPSTLNATTFSGAMASSTLAVTGATTLSGGVTVVGAVTANELTINALATPVNGTFSTATTGGTLAASTAYYYRVAATDSVGTTLASAQTSITTGSGSTNTVTVTWATVAGATGYKVYGRTTGAELLLATISSGATLTWTDTGSVTPSGALPTANTTGQLSMAGSATVGGALVVTGTVQAGNAVTITNTTTNPLLYLTNGTGTLYGFGGNFAANGICQSGDSGFLYTAASGFVIGDSLQSGGARWDSSGNMVETGNLTVSGGHLVAAVGTAPTVAVQSGAGVGASATLAAGSSDISGAVNLSTGSSGVSASSSLVTITFNKAFASAPKVFLFPSTNVSNVEAESTAQLSGGSAIWVIPTTTGFSVCSNTTTPSVNGNYSWNYLVIG